MTTKTTLNHPAPDFNLPCTSDKKIQLSSLKGKNVVLYFYPKDCTPGCTLETKDFTNNYQKFVKLDTEIFGISRDNLTLHEKFKAECIAPFDLIADTHETACALYDVMRDKNMYGKKVRGIERSTFLIDKKGILRKEWRKVKVENHVGEVLKAVLEIEKE